MSGDSERDAPRQHPTEREALEFCSGTSYIDAAHECADEALKELRGEQV